MSNPKRPTLSLKVMINKQKSKVLYAEANSDFIDVLLSFLTLPLGKIMRILDQHCAEPAPAIGSLSTLYKGLYHLDDTNFFARGAKKMFLNPRSSFEAECSKLILDITDSQPAKYFVCRDKRCSRSQGGSICMYSDVAACCLCGKLLSKEISAWQSQVRDHRVFTRNNCLFLISDDLRVVPVTVGFLRDPAVAGVLKILGDLGVADTEGAELRTMRFGINVVKDLLKLSLTSATPLTDLIINNGSTAAKPEAGVLSHHFDKEAVSGSSKKIILKVSLQKHTNRFLFAEATDEFLEFLFSFLTIPLGGIELLLGGKTCLKNIDNLYRSVTDFIDDKYFNTPDAKNKLINSKLAHGYISDSQFLPLKEESPPKLHCLVRWTNSVEDKLSYHQEYGASLIRYFRWCRGRENYVKKPTLCYVTDDLTITPSLASIISILNGFGIVLSDVKEMEFHIGMEEALSILKASLTSKTALSDVGVGGTVYRKIFVIPYTLPKITV